MAEKLTEVFEEYDMEVSQTRKGRGTIILYTDKGTRCLTPLSESEQRIEKEKEFKEYLYLFGFKRTDFIIPTKEEELFSFDRYLTPYVMRVFYEGKELSITDKESIALAIKNLVAFHIAGREVYKRDEDAKEIKSLEEAFSRKNTELRRIKDYIRRNKKREFELKYLDVFEQFYKKAEQVERYLCDINISEERTGYCHGTYDQHSVINDNGILSTINFGRFHVGNQLEDVYHYLRKALEKNDYNTQILKFVLDEYCKYIPLSREDYRYIYAFLAFPEKFYKISNQYMNARKAWLSPKLLEKLERVVEDSQKKEEMLKYYESELLE